MTDQKNQMEFEVEADNPAWADCTQHEVDESYSFPVELSRIKITLADGQELTLQELIDCWEDNTGGPQ